ncbi:dTDP-4-dehydrorhamnose reductase [Cupriavidus cauae]|uniref:dTDP-4-dehydrorhamnose reductase n=1 Tax=Cupriavidus cauae TaxID=2608999 RepID=A0A5M8AB95_9BURK|nr:dTDP-4-dehydrorhamnose reductase [Cupriavidus cauae]KAA6119160.1 dTDP-4-dehydrorhamnose reductase [Cupriavidus cauae]
MPRERTSPAVLLLTGCNGQVGFELRRSLAPLGKVVALDRSGLDLSHPDDARRVVREVRPDLIVNAAAYTAVDRAESEASLAETVNGIAPGVLAEEARAVGSLLVHYSTNYVFDGSKAAPYSESDAANPQSVYGRSKLAGEDAIAASGAAALVLRTGWVAGVHGANFAKSILALAREHENLRVVADQLGAPTTAALIADVTAQIVARFWLHGERERFPTGLYHLAAAGSTSWHGYAMEVLRYVQAKGVSLKADATAVEPIPASAYPTAARRPANSRLDTSKLRNTFGVHLPDWEQGIHHLLDQLYP